MISKTTFFGTILAAIAAIMVMSPAMAAVTNETGTVTSAVSPQTVTLDSGPGPFPVDGGFPAACNNVGDPVTFDIDLADIEPRASNVACVVLVVCDITISVDTRGSQEVPEGQTLCVVNGATISGNIKTDGGNIIVTEASTVTGIVKADIGDFGTLPSIIIEGGSTVGVVKIDEGSRLTLTDSTVSGKVKADETQEVTVTGSTIGNVKLVDSGDVSVTGNTIGGSLRISGTTGTCDDSGNTVTGTTDGCP